MTHQKKVNTVLFCNLFDFKLSLEGMPAAVEKPATGRVYEAHYDAKTDQYCVLVKGVVFVFDGDSGTNDSWDYDFTELTPRNLMDFNLKDEDIDMVEKFIIGKSEKFIDEAMPSVRIEEELSSEEEDDEDEDDEDDEEEEDEDSVSDVDMREAEESINKIMSMERDHARRIQDAVKSMNTMMARDPYLAMGTQDVLIHIGKCLGDKYYSTPIDTTKFIYDKHNGKGFNIGNSIKYLSRYMTEGYEKSNKKEDLYKAIHYCLFEIARLERNK